MSPALQFPSSHSVAVTALITTLCYIALRAIYYLVFSPLSSIPGPWYAALSDFWLTTHVLHLRQCQTIHELFEIYGPVVRVGPNKVVFRDVATSRSIYTVHKFDKSAYYKSLLTNENDHAMTTLEHADHAIRRKGYGPHYMHSNIAFFQPEAHDFTTELVHSLDTLSGKAPVDCLTFFRHLMVDVLVSANFGYRIGAVSKWAEGVEEPLSNAINDFPKRGILRSAVPTWAWNLVCRIPNQRWRQMCDSDKIMAEFVSARVYEMRAQMNAGKIGESEKIPLLHRLLQYKYASTGALMPDKDIISESMGHLIAGTDTTSISLSYFCWELSRRPDIMVKLQAELDGAMPDAGIIPDISVLQNLPYLNAFIKEGLRLYGAAPSLLERVVPSSTSKGAFNEDFDFMGFALPPGTIIGTQAWSIHRDTTVFPSPDTFLPDRWLETANNGNAGQLMLMAQHMMPFGMGSRICGGQNLAQLVMRVAIAAIARNFHIVSSAETTERTMEIKDSFVIFPASTECKLTFSPRK